MKTAAGCDSIVTTDLKVDQLNLAPMQDAFITAGNSVQLLSLVDPPGNYQYSWQPALALSCATCPETWAKPPVSTVYTLQVVALNQVCKRSEKVSVAVRPCGIYTPTAFSPNNDRDNDVFLFTGIAVCNRSEK